MTKANFMGLNLGDTSGWDEPSENALIFYDVSPSEELKNLIPELSSLTFRPSIAFLIESGQYEVYDEAGMPIITGNLTLTNTKIKV